MKKTNKLRFSPLLVVGLVLIVLFSSLFFIYLKNNYKPKKSTPGQSQEVTIVGEITCLPKSGQGPQTMECALGLKGEDGSYYALKSLNENGFEFTQTGTKVEVTGVLNEEEMFGPDGNKYTTSGTISVYEIKEH